MGSVGLDIKTKGYVWDNLDIKTNCLSDDIILIDDRKCKNILCLYVEKI